MRIAMIYDTFLDPHGNERRIGGVETYLWNLAALVAERGDEPIVFQAADEPFERRVGAALVVGVPSRGITRERLRRTLFKAATSRIRFGEEILIFGADHASVRVSSRKCISIQHGIHWDLPEHLLRGGWIGRLPLPPGFHKRRVIRRAKRFFANCPNRVCVDHNFVNWYRTESVAELNGNVWVIPNFVDTTHGPAVPARSPENVPVSILFARRFTQYRGSRLFAETIQALFAMGCDIRVTFAGEGPDEEWLRHSFAGDPRVRFARYSSDDAVAFHSQYDIAVVPSLGSEGTSLALAEAMGAGCAVVATNVGGMTNMVIDGFNGRLVLPRAGDLTRALDRLVADRDLRVRLGRCAMETAAASFSLQRWQEAWADVLDTVARG